MRQFDSPIYSPEYDARFAGLPSRRELTAQTERLRNKISLEVSGNPLRSEIPFMLPPMHEREFPQALYQEFREEFLEDVEGFSLRLERLKVRLLMQLAQGASPVDNALGYKERDALPQSRLGSELLNASQKGADTPSALIDKVNQYLPVEYRLKAQRDFSLFDWESLYKLSCVFRKSESKSSPDEKMIFEGFMQELLAIQAEIEGVQKQGKLFANAQGGHVSEQDLLRAWEKYRSLLQRVATAEGLSTWRSPTYGATGKGQIGKHQSSERMSRDYQRFYNEEVQSLEGKFNRWYFKDQQYQGDIQSVLVEGGGLSALELILTSFDPMYLGDDSEQERKRPVFVAKDTYYEVDSSLYYYCKGKQIELEQFDPENIEELAEYIKEFMPKMVVLSPLSNMCEMKMTDIAGLLERLCDEEWRMELYDKTGRFYVREKIYIVVDNTALGRSAKWKDFNFARLPDFVKVLSFESLLKYAQDGQELTMAGLITGAGRYALERIKETRKRRGYMPSTETVARLRAFVPPDTTDKKMARHARNAQVIAEALEPLAGENHFISAVHYPGLKSHPQHELAQAQTSGSGGIVNIALNTVFEGYKEHYYYNDGDSWYEQSLSDHEAETKKGMIADAFTNLVVRLAKEVGVELNKGTSFGFNTTRISYYEGSHGRQQPFVRISVGTENIKDIWLVAQVIERASQMFEQAKRKQRLVKFTNALNPNSAWVLKLGSTEEQENRIAV